MKRALLLVAITTQFQIWSIAQSPPDEPLTPQEWIDKMGIGSWWIFNIPPDEDSNIKTIYSPDALDSLQTKFCINGGRLHWNTRDFFNDDNELLQEPIDSLRRIIDDMMERDMAIALYVQLNPGELEKPMTAEARERQINGWTQLCQEFADVSHNFAMCPFIEFHGWEDLPYEQKIDSTNALYHELTLIFREYNPTRIMSYKPWGSAKRARFYEFEFPYGDDPLPGDEEQFYYVTSLSGSAGMGDWDTWSPDMPAESLDSLHYETMNAGLAHYDELKGINYAMYFRDSTGIPFWCDHWRPNYHKHSEDGLQWTMEQNLAYVEFFELKLLEIGSAGAGLQTRTFWDEDANDLIRLDEESDDGDTMCVLFMDLLANLCAEMTDDEIDDTGIDSGTSNHRVLINPNPFNNLLTLDGLKGTTSFSITDITGRKVDHLVNIEKYEERIKINTSLLPKGMYILRIENSYFQIIKN